MQLLARLAFAALALGTTAASLHGQSGGPPQVECRLLCFRHAKGLATLEAVGRDPGAIVSCKLPLSLISKPIRLPLKDSKIGFYEKVPAPGDTAPAKPVAIATVPANTRRAILFFAPAPEGSPYPYLVVVIRDDPRNFPFGGAAVCNLYSDQIRFIIGEHKNLLPTGKVAYLKAPAKIDDFNMAYVAFQFRAGDDWRTTHETKLRFVEPMRHLLFTYIDPVTKRPRLKTYRDVPVFDPAKNP